MWLLAEQLRNNMSAFNFRNPGFTSLLSLSINLFDDFLGSSLNNDIWAISGSNQGTVAVSNSELTITNTSGTSSTALAVYSKQQFPVNSIFTVRARGISGRHHALIGFSQGPGFFPYPHANADTVGFTWYGRADVGTSTLSWRNTNGTTGFVDPAPVNNLNSYQTIQLYRVSSSEVRVFYNGVLRQTVTGLNLPNDSHVFFSSDGFTRPNAVRIDWVSVEVL